jgi:DNA polymerase-3 subunit delta'
MRVRPEAVAAAEGASVESDDSEPTASEGGAVGKKKLSEELKVEQIRALEPWYHRATHRGGWRIVVLYPADRLSVISANALLKALEEPPPNTLFFLTSDAPDRLLPTVLSRCQKFALTRPDPAQSVAWLAEQGLTEPEQWLAAAGGAPLAALAMRETLESPCPAWARSMIFDLSQGKMVDVAGMADQLAKGPATAWLSVLQRLAVDIGFACAGLQSRFYPGLESAFRQIGARASMQSANELSAWINQQNRLASHPLSPKLFAQVSLQHFCDAVL